MKILLVLTCVSLSCYALDKKVVQEFVEKIQQIAPACISETKASDSDLEELMARKMPPSTHEGKCLISCFHKPYIGYKVCGCFQRKLHVMNEDGTIGDGDPEDAEKMKANDEDFYNKMMSVHKTCKENVAVDADPCETGTNMLMCVKEESTKLGISEDLLDV